MLSDLIRVKFIVKQWSSNSAMVIMSVNSAIRLYDVVTKYRPI